MNKYSAEGLQGLHIKSTILCMLLNIYFKYHFLVQFYVFSFNTFHVLIDEDDLLKLQMQV